VHRVLVISIPHVGWADLRSAHVPNLQRLLRGSAVADLTARNGGGGPGAGYLTLGAGKRAVGTTTTSDGLGFGVGERFGTSLAGAAFAGRTGTFPPSGSVVDLGIVGITDANASEPGGSSVGALGSALHGAGWTTAVIGNSDGSAPDDQLPQYRRYLVGGLMTRDGVVDGGRVDVGLLEPDPAAPFGVRLDNAATVAAFTAAWADRSVVMVEASDLPRQMLARTFSNARQDTRTYRDALTNTDELVGALLDQVDLSRDAVVVVSPNASRRTGALTVVGVHAPGFGTGLMKSGSTRRVGFVLLADVAPTVLQLAGIPKPTSMNGRPFVVARSGGTATHREQHLVRETSAALFRDRVINPVTLVTTIAAGLVALGAVLAWELRRRRRLWRVAARIGASWLLGLIPMVFLARLLPFHAGGVAKYWAFLLGGAALLAAACELVGRGRARTATSLGLGVIVGLLVLDLVTGAHLQISTAFGYTPSIGVRFSGVGNVAFAFLGAAAVLWSGLLAHRIGGRRGAWVATAMLALVLVADGAPMLGGDVGGVLALTPAFLVAALLLFEVRLRRRTVVGVIAAVVAVIGAVSAVDLLRPARDRTHLGSLLANTQRRGLSEFVDVVARKLSRNLETWGTSPWRTMFFVGALFVAYLVWRRRPVVRALVSATPELRASLVGLVVLVVLGYALNDSGVAIPAVMFVVFVGAAVGLLVRLPPTADDAVGDPDGQPDADSTSAVLAATPSH